MYDAWADLGRSSMRFGERAHAIRPSLYIVVIVGAMLVSFLYTLRQDGIFSCQANGYSSDHYLAGCTAAAYDDYEHGAFWFGLEPAALEAAARADVIFLSDSRVQVAFSTPETAEWFASIAKKFYLLGFGYRENMIFIDGLLRKIKPQAKVYVLNIDSFFERKETPPAKVVMHDWTAAVLYKAKQMWQSVHRPICTYAPGLCGNRPVVFRSRETGAYIVGGGVTTTTPITYDLGFKEAEVAEITASAKEMIPRLNVNPECIILTSVPHSKSQFDPTGTRIATSRAVAANLRMNFVVPDVQDLETFDQSHLERSSAQRWSKAFLELAGPQIRRCLEAS